jgi:Ribonuclease G/E
VKLQVFPTLDEHFAERPDAKQQLGDLILGKIPAIENHPE